MSAEREAFASIRVQATCMAMGQAAGVAAGIYCADRADKGAAANVSKIDTALLTDKLCALGGIVKI